MIYVENLFTIKEPLRIISRFTQVIDLTLAPSAQKLSLKVEIWKSTQEYTLARGHTHAIIVKRHSSTQPI